MGVFVVFPPPPRPPRVRTSVRMVDVIAGWVDGERKDTTTTGSTGWRAHGHRRHAGSGSGTDGGADGGAGITIPGSAGVEYQWSHASILDATAE